MTGGAQDIPLDPKGSQGSCLASIAPLVSNAALAVLGFLWLVVLTKACGFEPRFRNFVVFAASVSLLPAVSAAIQYRLGPDDRKSIFESINVSCAVFALLALAIAGIVLLSPFADVSRGLDPVGVLFALAAVGCWALYIIFAQKAGTELGVRTSAYGMAIAAVIALPFGFTAARGHLADPAVMAVAAVVGLFSSALPFWL